MKAATTFAAVAALASTVAAAVASESAATHTWGDWATSTSTPITDTTSTSTSTNTESTPTHTWGDWTTSTSEDPTTTPPTETSRSWGDWSSTDTPPDTWTSTVVTSLETYCPKPTKITHAGKTYDITTATTLTITDCPCTISVPLWTETSTACSEATGTEPCGEVVPTATGSWGDWETPSATPAPTEGPIEGPIKESPTTVAPIGTYTPISPDVNTGAAPRVVNLGGSLAGVGAIAAFFL